MDKELGKLEDRQPAAADGLGDDAATDGDLPAGLTAADIKGLSAIEVTAERCPHAQTPALPEALLPTPARGCRSSAAR